MEKLPKRQHYVPQFVLRRFAEGNQLFAYDIRRRRTFTVSVRDAAAERGFYNFPEPAIRAMVANARTNSGVDAEVVQSLEPTLAKIETDAAQVIEQVLSRGSLFGMTDGDRYLLAFFVVVQYLRGPDTRRMIGDTSAALSAKVSDFLRARGRAGDAEEAERELGRQSQDDLRVRHFRLMLSATKLLPHFLDKTWMLQRAPSGAAFYIGDSPVTLWNYGPRGQSRTRGFGPRTQGTEIALPLSPGYCLVLQCTSLLKQIRELESTAARLKVRASSTLVTASALIRAAETGTPIEITRENMDHANSLQVSSAHRFVYSSDGDFTLARDILDDFESDTASDLLI